ncbi:MAG: hypothetical protein ACU84J_03550, partial [Gammaproteobacteria bacterium]
MYSKISAWTLLSQPIKILIFLILNLSINQVLAGARVIVVIQDEFRSSGNTMHISENMLRSALNKAGFSVLNAEQLANLKSRDERLYLMDNDLDTAAVIDLQHDAEYIIRGHSTITSGKPILRSNMKPRNVSLGLELYTTDTG